MNNDILKSLEEDVLFLRNKLHASKCPDDLREEIDRKIFRIIKTAQFGGFSADFENISKYVDWVSRIPWNIYTPDNLSLIDVKKNLDRHHYGMDKVKERILEYIAVMKLKMDVEKTNIVRAPVMCFVGLQGIGKTSFAKAIGESMGRKVIRIAMGGLGSTYQLRGKPRTGPDGEPGQIVKALIEAKSMNPVIILDELDKVSGNSELRKDFMAILLEILDPEQNYAFRDHYIDYPLDLSKVFFICTANNLGTISAALLDRLEVIRFFSYTDEEKIAIGKYYILPQILREVGLTSEQIEFSDNAWISIVRPLGFDAGIRQLKRNLYSICRKVAKIIVLGKAKKVVITENNAKSFIDESYTVG